MESLEKRRTSAWQVLGEAYTCFDERRGVTLQHPWGKAFMAISLNDRMDYSHVNSPSPKFSTAKAPQVVSSRQLAAGSRQG